VNGHSIDKIGEFVERDGALLGRRHELDDLGFRLPESASASPDDLIALSELPGLAWRLDLASQTVFVTADLKLLKPALLELEAPTSANVPVQSGLGATLNYDVTATTTGGHNVGNGLIDTRVFSPWGVLSSSELAYAGSSPYGPGTNAALRLDSSYVYSDPDALRQYSVGDVINGGLAWTRPVRMGGVQVTQNFSMRPDLVTMPLPTVSGAVAVPSTVDVLVNGSQLLARQVQAGPFQDVPRHSSGGRGQAVARPRRSHRAPEAARLRVRQTDAPMKVTSPKQLSHGTVSLPTNSHIWSYYRRHVRFDLYTRS